MKLFATKPCSFCGKNFFIGDEIPTNYVLDPNAQEKMGVLVVVDKNSGISDNNSNTGDVGSDAGGSLLPPVSTLDSDSESDDEETVEKYTKSKFTHMNKDEILAIAAELGVEANADMSKAEIADLIIEKQGE